MIGILHRLNRMYAEMALVRATHAPAPKGRPIIETPDSIEAAMPFTGACELCVWDDEWRGDD